MHMTDEERDIDRKRFLKKMQLIYFEGLVLMR